MTSLKGKPESDLQKMWSRIEVDVYQVVRKHTLISGHYVDKGDTFLGFNHEGKKYRIEIKEVK